MKKLSAVSAYFAVGVCAIGLAVLAADRLADADPFLVSDLMQSKGGFKFSVMAQRLRDTSCAYECWEQIKTLNTTQLGCLNEQMAEVRDMLATSRNAAYLKKTGIEEVRVRLVDNSNGKLPGEKKYEETKGFILKWIMEVKTLITKKEECHVASSKILSELLEHKVTDEAMMEEGIQNAQNILQVLIKAPRRVTPPAEPVLVEFETPGVGFQAKPELNNAVVPADLWDTSNYRKPAALPE